MGYKGIRGDEGGVVRIRGDGTWLLTTTILGAHEPRDPGSCVLFSEHLYTVTKQHHTEIES